MASAEAPEDPPLVAALAPGADTALDQVFARDEAQHPGQSGFRLVSDGPEAFAIRARTAALAGRSLDVQTYIWHADLTGCFLAQRLLEAADRGVKVRLLVDDLAAGRGSHRTFAALDAHPNLEVRFFNPFRARRGFARFAIEALSRFRRVNRRMHNKSWIADNRIAVVGGRNLGDEYFGASEDVNFVDLDFAMVGPVVRDASISFDRYWNASVTRRVVRIARADVDPRALEALRARLEAQRAAALESGFARELRRSDGVQRLVAGDWEMTWAADFAFVADDAEKAAGKEGGVLGSNVLAALGPAVAGARSKLLITSPYFVPGEAATSAIVRVAQSGCEVGILTNSLAASDVAVVYGGYAAHRKPLLEGGVKLWELKPLPGRGTRARLFGSSGASLHTKALTLDGTLAFVGSYNLDPRSTTLNTEQGVIVRDAGLARRLERLFLAQSTAARAWSVTLERGELRWRDDRQVHRSPPAASLARRFQAWLAAILPITSQL